MTTIVSADGEPLMKIEGNDDVIRMNTPAGCQAVDDPPFGEYYRAGNVWVPLPPRPSDSHTFNYKVKLWIDSRTLVDAKAEKWNGIKQQRDALEFGGFEYRGNIYDSDQVSQGRILGAVNLGVDQVWTLADNSTVYLNSDELVDLYAALQEHISNLHERSRIAREKIESAQTIPEVEAVTL